MRNLFLFFSSLVILMSSQTVFGQTTAEVSGYVKDEHGAYIVGAQIEIRNLSTNILRSVKSNVNGFFRLIQLSPGTYELSVRASGFSDYINKEIMLEVRSVINKDIILSVKRVNEQVSVNSGSESVVDVTRSEVSQVINLRQIDQLPINGRRFVDFALLTPNVTLSRDGRASNNQIADGGLSFGGMRSWMNNFLVDGIESNNLYNGAIINSLSQEAVQEFQVSAGGYTAEVGRTAGGLINIITKSGTNEYHGSLYYFMRNDALDARPGLTRKGEDHFRQNQFGGTFGGPFQRNNTFFFVNYEGQRKSKQVGFSNAFIQNLESINQRKADFGLPSEDPSVLPSDNYNELFIRVDRKFNKNVTAFARYNLFDNGLKAQFVGGSILPSAGDNTLTRNQTIMGSSTALLKDNLLNEFSAGYSLRERSTQSSNRFSNKNSVALNLVDVGLMGHLQINIPKQEETQFEITDNVSYIRDNHNIRFGIQYSRVDSEAVLAYFDPPIFVTNLAGFLANPPRFSLVNAQEPGAPVSIKSTAFGWFLQDSWRARTNLTFNYGLRYDVEEVTATRWSDRILNRPTLGGADKNNFQPRVGLVYSVGAGKIILRSAFGIFHDKRITQNYLYELTFNPRTGAARVYSPVTNLSEVFLQYVSGTNLSAAQFGPLAAQGIDTNSFVSPYSIQWTIGVERLVKKNIAVGVRYLGVKGTHLISQASGERTNIAPWDGKTLAQNGVPDYRFQRIDSQFSQYRFVSSEGNSIYHGMSLNMNKRFSSHFAFNINYTLSKAIDDSTHLSSSSSSQDPYRRDLDRGLSNNDVRHRFTFDLTAEAPRNFPHFLSNLRGALIASANSGRPYSYRAGIDLNHDFLSTTDRVGLSGRNVFTGPGFASVDVRISRLLRISERLNVEIIAEAFNVFNRFNIQDINDIYGRATFDQQPLPTFRTPTAAFDPREIQLAVKFRF
jgi:hypothetical protein